MKKQTVALIALVAFAAGFIAALIWTSYKGPPPLVATPQTAVTREAPTVSDEHQARLEALENRLQTEPENFDLLVEAGNISFDRDLFKQAIAYYERALKVHPDNPDVLTDLGIMYRRTGDPEKAVSLFRQAIKADPLHQNAALNLGVVLLHDLKDKEGALKAWEAYLALNPQDPRAENIRRVVNQLRQNP